MTQRERRVPFFVGGADVNCLTRVEQFEPRAFGFPRTRRRLTREFKGGLQPIRRGLSPGELTRRTWTKLKVEKKRGMRSRAVRRSASHKEDGEESACLSSEDVDHLRLRGGHALPVNRDEHRAQFEFYFSIRVGFVCNGHAPAHRVGLWNPVFG